MLDFLTKYSMYLFVLAGLLAGVPVVWKFRAHAGIERRVSVGLLCLLYSASSVISAMLFAYIEALISGDPNAGFGAISTYGIYLIGPFILLLSAVLFRLKPAGVMDLFSLYAMPSLFSMRCHCLVSGCCFGRPLSDTGLKWPTRESEMVFYGIMFVVFWKMAKKNKSPGQLFPLLMISYGVFRFINQWLRDSGTMGWHLSHTWSVICALIGVCLLVAFRIFTKKKAPEKQGV